MSDSSKIQWCNATWNPVVGCTRVHAGCDNCYAVKQSYRNERMGSEKYAGLTVLNKRGERHFAGVVRTVPEALTIPLKWRKPRRVFVNSMSDLFHKDVPLPFIVKTLAIMALCPQHTFQVLTKRPERGIEIGEDHIAAAVWGEAESICFEHGLRVPKEEPWPLPNLWLGCSVSDQATADAAIPHLLRCPAAVRFVSYEPALGAVDFSKLTLKKSDGLGPDVTIDALKGWNGGANRPERTPLQWVIVGGESGPGARPFNVAWARAAIKQCRAAGVACFVKQLGRVVGETNPSGESVRAWGETLIVKSDDGVRYMLRDPKGGDWSEWPEDLRVREWPKQ
jgi:protein gp37